MPPSSTLYASHVARKMITEQSCYRFRVLSLADVRPQCIFPSRELGQGNEADVCPPLRQIFFKLALCGVSLPRRGEQYLLAAQSRTDQRKNARTFRESFLVCICFIAVRAKIRLCRCLRSSGEISSEPSGKRTHAFTTGHIHMEYMGGGTTTAHR